MTKDTWESLNEAVTHCRLCSRLVEWREKVAREKRRAYRDWDYWGKPVPGFGDQNGRLLIVGLAPGAHGSNRTGRVFSGDSSGDTLFGAMFRTGFANQPTGHHIDDGLQLFDSYITAIGRCAPPKNKPTRPELSNCAPYLAREWLLMPQTRVLLALGQMAFDGCLRLLQEMDYTIPKLKFGHGAYFPVTRSSEAKTSSIQNTTHSDTIHLLAAYHPSRQNTQTGRLTQAMLDAVFEKANQLING
ncbi:MAG: uracil-DNA glycosylase [Chloroflexota bacterium]